MEKIQENSNTSSSKLVAFSTGQKNDILFYDIKNNCVADKLEGARLSKTSSYGTYYFLLIQKLTVNIIRI